LRFRTNFVSVELVLSDVEEILRVAEALSSVTRVNILKLTSREAKSVTRAERGARND